MIVECNAGKFRGMRNPYTGEEMNVKMLVRPDGNPMFFCPDTYSTATRFPTALAAIEAWDRQDGVGGLKSRDSMKCAYTGKDLHVAEDCAGFYLEGGFDPHRLTTDDEFVHFARMRDGVSPVPAPPVRTRVDRVERVDVPDDDTEDDGPDGEMMKVAEETVGRFKDSLGLRKNVTVNGADLRGKRRR